MSSKHGVHHHGHHHGHHYGHHHSHGGSHGSHAGHHAAARSAAHHAAQAAHRTEEGRRIAREAAKKQAEKDATRRREQSDEGRQARHDHKVRAASSHGHKATVSLEDSKGTVQKQALLSEGGTATGPSGKAQMKNLLNTAERHAGHKHPGGWCYRAVKQYIAHTPGGYGGLNASNIHKIPQAKARDFADYMNRNDNAAKHGLRKLDITNPYDAPPGALVVVAPGTPGTHHPTAGDITIAAGHGRFFNDGNMGYGGPRNFPPGNRHVLGIYVPAQ